VSAPDGWGFAYEDRVRFGDLDAMRHLNNVAFLGFFESARIAYVTTLIPTHRPTDPEGDDFGLIFAEAHISYRAPGFYDDEIRTLVRVADVKRSSFRVEFRMEATGDGRLLAEGWGALVGYDYVAGAAKALPASLVATLEREVERIGTEDAAR
jgi:acyl-CoA thioester hydrolase